MRFQNENNLTFVWDILGEKEKNKKKERDRDRDRDVETVRETQTYTYREREIQAGRQTNSFELVRLGENEKRKEIAAK
jgi:hypothetical protein